MTKLILATTSKPRERLFSTLGLDFVCEASGVDEDAVLNKPESPQQLARYLAKLKSEAVANRHSSGIVIGLDTVGQYIGGTTRNPWEETLEKPKSKEEVFERLKTLSGKIHYLFTGIHIINIDNTQVLRNIVQTKVFMRKLGEDEINKYLNQVPLCDRTMGYEPMASYSATFVEKIEGSPSNFNFGFPVERVMPMLFEIGYRIPE
mgnify:CR=1 FL=1